MKKDKSANLSDFVENPTNPSFATDDEIERLAGKIGRNNDGLRAMRIAYVTDMEPGRNTVISGNKRLRVLKRIFGESGEVPSEYFVDVTSWSLDQRKEFIVNANISDGEWDFDALLSQYANDELLRAGFSQELLDSVSGSMVDAICDFGEEAGNKEKTQSDMGTVVIHIEAALMSKWRSYNRKHGTDRIVEFIRKELKENA